MGTKKRKQESPARSPKLVGEAKKQKLSNNTAQTCKRAIKHKSEETSTSIEPKKIKLSDVEAKQIIKLDQPTAANGIDGTVEKAAKKTKEKKKEEEETPTTTTDNDGHEVNVEQQSLSRRSCT